MMQDKLQKMFDKQKEFQKRLSNVTLPERRPDLIPMQITGLVSELGEVLGEYKEWKNWKKNFKPVDNRQLLDEVADVWTFLINITLCLGIDAEELYAGFINKNNVNNKRQDENY